MDEITKDILKEAFDIGVSHKFLIRFYESNKIIYIEKTMNYIELGTFLTKSVDNIEIIHIYAKDE